MSYPPEVNNGTTTSWLPLTTTYVAPASCTSFFYAPAAVVAVNDYVYINDPNDANALLPTPCLPDIVTLWWDQDKASVTNVVTSIGPLVCPAGYEVVWSRDDQGRNANSALTACCPSGFDYTPGTSSPYVAGSVEQCESWFQGPKTLTYVLSNTTQLTASLTATNYDTTTLEVPAGESVLVKGVQVNGWNFPSSVSATTTTSGAVSSSSSSSSSSSASATTTIPSSSTTSSPTSSTTKSSLSPGAAAGIGVAASATGLILFSVLFFFMRRHYARRRLAAAATLALADDHMRFTDKDPHQGGESANLTSNLYERSYEMDGGLQMSELASPNDAHELNA